MKKITLTNCDHEVFVDDCDYEDLSDFEWYEYKDPFLDQTFVAHDTPSGRRVLMHDVIDELDVLDDDQVFDFGSMTCEEADQIGPLKREYKGRFLVCPDEYFQVTSNFGPPAHFETTEEYLESFSTDRVIDEQVKARVLEHFVEEYREFIADLNTDKSVEGNGTQGL